MGVRISPPLHLKNKHMLEKIRNSLSVTTEELVNKVTWPTWAELQSSAIVVLVSAIIIAMLVFLVDSGLENLFKYFYQITR
ncbi:MAG: preprotein translocase subunit SecE [Chitinophagaceae bacterium]|nr:MAG: preprotein translocase subunit SecE [Chitinophagaceae bacterium]